MVVTKKAFKSELNTDLKALKKLIGVSNTPRDVSDLSFLEDWFEEKSIEARVKTEYKDPFFGKPYIKTTIKTEDGSLSIYINHVGGDIYKIKEKGFANNLKRDVITGIKEKCEEQARYLGKQKEWKKATRDMPFHSGGVADRES